MKGIEKKSSSNSDLPPTIFFFLFFFLNPNTKSQIKPTERCLDADEKPYELMQHWEKVPDKKKAAEESYNAIFLFKKKIFLKDDEKEMEDPVAMDLIYQQAGRYLSFFPSSIFSSFCFPFLFSFLIFSFIF